MANIYRSSYIYGKSYNEYTKEPFFGYNTYGSLHASVHYTISTLSIEDGEEVENEFDIDFCCSSCLKISHDKFVILRNACINRKTFIVPSSVNSKASFLTRVFTHNIETR